MARGEKADEKSSKTVSDRDEAARGGGAKAVVVPIKRLAGGVFRLGPVDRVRTRKQRFHGSVSDVGQGGVGTLGVSARRAQECGKTVRKTLRFSTKLTE